MGKYIAFLGILGLCITFDIAIAIRINEIVALCFLFIQMIVGGLLYDEAD